MRKVLSLSLAAASAAAMATAANLEQLAAQRMLRSGARQMGDDDGRQHQHA